MVLNYIILTKYSCIQFGHTRDLRQNPSRLLLPVAIVINCALSSSVTALIMFHFVILSDVQECKS